MADQLLERIQDCLAKLRPRKLHDIYLLNEGLMVAISVPDGLMRFFCKPGTWEMRWPMQGKREDEPWIAMVQAPSSVDLKDLLGYALEYAQRSLVPIPTWPEPKPVGKAD